MIETLPDPSASSVRKRNGLLDLKEAIRESYNSPHIPLVCSPKERYRGMIDRNDPQTHKTHPPSKNTTERDNEHVSCVLRESKSFQQAPSFQPPGDAVVHNTMTHNKQNKQHKKTIKTTKTTITKRAGRKASAPARAIHKHREARKKSRSGGAGSAYVNALRRPFFSPAPKLGFGTLVPTSVRSAWQRGSVSSIDGSFASCSSWMVVNTPITGASNAGIFSNTTGYLTTVGVPNSGSPFNGATTAGSSGVFNSGAQNGAVLAGLVNSSRVISGALRVTVRYPLTAARGIVYAGFIPDASRFALGTFNAATLCAMPFMKMCSSNAAGELTCEVQYRPSEISDYIFDAGWCANTPASSASAMPQLIVVGMAWLGTYSIDISVITHYECLAGLTQGASDQDDSSLPNDVLTMEQAARAAITAGPSVLTTQSITDSIDSFTSNISRFGRFGTGGAHVMRGMLTQNTIDPLAPLSSGSSSVVAASSSVKLVATEPEEDESYEHEYGVDPHDLSQSTILALKRIVLSNTSASSSTKP